MKTATWLATLSALLIATAAIHSAIDGRTTQATHYAVLLTALLTTHALIRHQNRTAYSPHAVRRISE